VYELDARQVHAKLKAADISFLYHANTVRTVCTFLRDGHLLSRGTLDERGLTQTPQYTDQDDKDLSIWYDVFLDTVDIQASLGRANLYGPVLLGFDVDLLLEDWLTAVWITKSNPANWKKQEVTYAERYFSSDELGESYDPTARGAFANHIVLRNIGGVLRLKPYLKQFILDDPKRAWPDYERFDLLSMAWGGMTNAARAADMLPLEGVQLRDCEALYSDMDKDKLLKAFCP